MDARKSILAGSWYPGTHAGCEKEIKQFINDPNIPKISGKPFVGGIVPHAGWYYSGSLACHVIRCLADDDPPDIVAVFGMHLHPGSSPRIMAEGAWETPLGKLNIAEDLAAELVRQFDFVLETAQRNTQDNTIEVQLPFIKYFFQDVCILPMGVPPTNHSLEIAKAAADSAKGLGKKMKVIGSTDLTHYGDNYGFSPKDNTAEAIEWVRQDNDHRIIEAMFEMDPEKVIQMGLAQQNACCAGAAASAITAAERLGAHKARTIGYANSYDKNPGDSFVGYVGMVFES